MGRVTGAFRDAECQRSRTPPAETRHARLGNPFLLRGSPSWSGPGWLRRGIPGRWSMTPSGDEGTTTRLYRARPL